MILTIVIAVAAYVAGIYSHKWAAKKFAEVEASVKAHTVIPASKDAKLD